MTKSNFKVSDIDCESCIKLLKMDLPEKISGIEKIDIDLKGNMEITANHEISRQEMDSALEGTDHKII